MIDRLLSAFVAVSLALLIWLYARSRDQEVLDHVPIPVEVTLGSGQSDQYNLDIVNPAEVLATFTGPPARIRELRGLLQRDLLRVELSFTVPADRLKENRIYETLQVENSHIHAPPGVNIVLVAGRNHVRIVLDRLGEKRMPVWLDPSLAERADASRIDPATVLVRGPLEVLERTGGIVTQALPLPAASTRKSVKVPLVRELEGRPIECDPDTVRVPLVSTPLKKTHDLCDVPVHFLMPVSFAYRPRLSEDRGGRVTLRVSGPVQEEAPRPIAYVDLTAARFSEPSARNALGRRWFDEPVQVQLPPGYTLEQPAPPAISFELIPAGH